MSDDTTAKTDDAEQTTVAAATKARAKTATKDAGEPAKPQTVVSQASDTKQADAIDEATKQDVTVEAESEKANASQAEVAQANVATQTASVAVPPAEASSAKTSSAKTKSVAPSVAQSAAASSSSPATPDVEEAASAPLDEVAKTNEANAVVAEAGDTNAANASAVTSAPTPTPVTTATTTTATATIAASTATTVEEATQAAKPDDEAIAAAEWRVITETVPGASHLRNGIPNQDSVLQFRQSSASLPIIVAVADGHGSDKCFRSDRGSRYAVRTGAELLDEIVNSERGKLNAAELEEELRERLPAEFVRRWRADVEADLKREPIKEEEFARLVEKDGARARQLVEANTLLAYGTTTLHVLLTETFALYLQLGDGEIITVSETGEVALPLPGDARLLANETTSLCLKNAAEDFRFVVKAHEGHAPAMILLTTDGYYNSFSTTEGFLQVGSDLFQMLGEEKGFDTVNRAVKGWLEEATRDGSGDDCSLAIVVNMDALRKATDQTDAG